MLYVRCRCGGAFVRTMPTCCLFAKCQSQTADSHSGAVRRTPYKAFSCAWNAHSGIKRRSAAAWPPTRLPTALLMTHLIISDVLHKLACRLQASSRLLSRHAARQLKSLAAHAQPNAPQDGGSSRPMHTNRVHDYPPPSYHTTHHHPQRACASKPEQHRRARPLANPLPAPHGFTSKSDYILAVMPTSESKVLSVPARCAARVSARCSGWVGGWGGRVGGCAVACVWLGGG